MNLFHEQVEIWEQKEKKYHKFDGIADERKSNVLNYLLQNHYR